MLSAYAARGFIYILARPSPQSSTTFFTSHHLSAARFGLARSQISACLSSGHQMSLT
jgi:hypothetical protein